MYSVLGEIRTDEKEFTEEIQNLSKYLNAKIIEEKVFKTDYLNPNNKLKK